MQEIDGGWEIGWIYKYGSSGARIGSRGLSTAFAIAALRASKGMLPKSGKLRLLQYGSKQVPGR
jgi:hypothetical protein